MSNVFLDEGSGPNVLVEAMFDSECSSSSSCSASMYKGGSPNPASTTYLGSNLWDQTIPFDPDCKDSLDYLELENFLEENREFIDITNLIDPIDDKKDCTAPSEDADLSTPVHVPEYFSPPIVEEESSPPRPKETTNPPTTATTVLPSFLLDTLSVSSCTDDNSLDSCTSSPAQRGTTPTVPLSFQSPCTSLPKPSQDACMPLEKKRPLSDDEGDEPVSTKKLATASNTHSGIENFAQLSISPTKKPKAKKERKTEGRIRKRSRKGSDKEDNEFKPHESSKKKSSKKQNKSDTFDILVDSKLPLLPKVDLKPKTAVKKSSKKYVPSEEKDEKYWARRQKNNVAAKRSRDARRIKENQIVLRATIIEEEHAKVVEELKKANKLIESLKKRLLKYEKV